MVTSVEASKEPVPNYNIDTTDYVSVVRISNAICEEIGLKNVSIKGRMVEENGRGWAGDARFVELEVATYERPSWELTMDSEEAGRSAARGQVSNHQLHVTPKLTESVELASTDDPRNRQDNG